jgi:hypothetical protein
MRMTDAQKPGATREQCADCGATLLDDQRYCLQCGARRGNPRIDFTAFWKSVSPTGTQSEAPVAPGEGRAGTLAPSHRLVGAMAAGVLAVGLIVGAAIGPSPSGSPADASTLAQRAIAALITRASASPPPRTPTSPASTPASEPSPPASAPSKPAKVAPKPAAAPAPSESSSPSEPSSGTPSSESSKGSPDSGKSEKPAPGTPIKLPPVKHIWVIALSGMSFSTALADASADPYLAKQLVPKGTLLSNYTLSASSALGNGIALLSGQGVNLDTEQNCPTYSELQPPTVNATTGLAEGVGCVYPSEVKTLANELSDANLTWKAYVQDMDQGAPTPTEAGGASGATTPGAAAASGTSSATGTSTSTGIPSATSTPDSPATPPTSGTAAPASSVTCRRPELGATDPNHTPAPGDPYLTYRNPFVYFDSLLGEGACASNDVDLSQLQASLATPANTPSFSWIVPSACNDGSSTPCAPSAPAGLAAADSFLKAVVPEILATSTYGKEGLIAIVPDSPASSTPASGAAQPVGALLLSPFVHSGARVSESFDDFSLSKSLSLLFGVLPLGHAGDPSTVSFGATVYSTTK